MNTHHPTTTENFPPESGSSDPSVLKPEAQRDSVFGISDPRKALSDLAKLVASFALGVLGGIAACGAEPAVSVDPIGKRPNVSLQNEVQHAIDRGTAWLIKNQDAKGYWSTADHPAVTALALVALQGGAAGGSDAARAAACSKGYEFILGHVRPDGGIYGAKKELPNYNTAISVMALLAAGRADYKPVILKARQHLIGSQNDLGEPGKADDVYDGGIGYGSHYRHSDMGNTLSALEAIYYSRELARDEKLAEARDLNWDAVLHFIQNCQNLPARNRQPWASDDPQNRGGFVYYPGHSMAGQTNLADGRIALRSYGSISYGGMLSYAYADLKRDDPRVQAVLEWLKGNYTLEENPGMGAQGLFFYFHTMTKALNIYDISVLETKSGRTVNWRGELALKLMNLQQSDGSWSNPNARWWEKDPALSTSYAVISLEMIRRKL
jgi:squalene-hopene/tetraprenyl-beta-curcumene cyclase